VDFGVQLSELYGRGVGVVVQQAPHGAVTTFSMAFSLAFFYVSTDSGLTGSARHVTGCHSYQ
jgi:hypothetical protein